MDLEFVLEDAGAGNGTMSKVDGVNRTGGAGDVVGTPPLVQTSEPYRGRMLNTCTSNYIRGTRCGNKYVL